MAVEGPRGARTEEVAAAAELASSVFWSGKGISMGDHFPLLFHKDNAEDLRVFVDEGRPVSLVGMLQRGIWLLGTRHRCGCIGSVCTGPDYRGQGLATRLVHDARAKALHDGADILLISGSRSLYTRQGYARVGGYATCAVTRKQLPERGDYTVRRWKPEDVPALVRLRTAEPVRFARTPEDFQALLGVSCVAKTSGDTRVICVKRGAPVAYVSCKRPGSHRVEKDETRIEEMAGSRWAIARSLGRLFDEFKVERIKVNYLDCDTEVAELARRFGWSSEPLPFGGTVGIIEPERFWQACAPLFEERLGRETFAALDFRVDGEAVTLALGDETLALDNMAEFTRLVFLPARQRGELELGLGPESELGRALDQIFPMPLVAYGLNFV